MPLSITRRPGDRIRFRVDRSFAWLTVLSFVGDDVLLRLANGDDTQDLRLGSDDAIHFEVGGKDIEVWMNPAHPKWKRNHIRLSFGADGAVEVMREELLGSPKAS